MILLERFFLLDHISFLSEGDIVELIFISHALLPNKTNLYSSPFFDFTAREFGIIGIKLKTLVHTFSVEAISDRSIMVIPL